MPVIPLELIDKYDAYVGRYVYLCGNENRERIDLRLVFRDGKEIGTDDLNLYYNQGRRIIFFTILQLVFYFYIIDY